jgi:hypothetical protein
MGLALCSNGNPEERYTVMNFVAWVRKSDHRSQRVMWVTPRLPVRQRVPYFAALARFLATGVEIVV